MPPVVPLCELVTPRDHRRPYPTRHDLPALIGLDTDELEPLSVDLRDGPHFLIAGPARSGKTTLLHSWLLALANHVSPALLHLYLIDFRWAGLRPLRDLPHVRAYIDDDTRLTEALAAIAATLQARRAALESARQAGGPLDERDWISRHPAVVVVIDDVDAFTADAQLDHRDQLAQLMRRERGAGFHVLLAGQTSDLESNYDDFVKATRAQAGFCSAATMVTCNSSTCDCRPARLASPCRPARASSPSVAATASSRSPRPKPARSRCLTGARSWPPASKANDMVESCSRRRYRSGRLRPTGASRRIGPTPEPGGSHGPCDLAASRDSRRTRR
jgi:hypothetical protein